jgi:UDP-galactopyranose mutase
MKVDCLVVGAGFAGAVAAERLASAGRSVLVVERRAHPGGNAWDEPEAHGVRIHRYGPHIFHTNSEAVVGYLSRFTEWMPYEHRVLGSVDGVLVPIPFNLTSLACLFPAGRAERIEARLTGAYAPGARVPVLELRRHEDPELRELGEYVYEKVFLHYTVKQWGLRPEELSPTVTARVPVMVGRDDRYFQDRFQALPRDGYAGLFRRLLDHPRIEVLTGVEHRDLDRDVSWDRMIYTGPVDELLGHRHGPLPYRGLRFETRYHATDSTQRAAVVNYPGDEPFTRITDMAMLTGQRGAGTVTFTEYAVPCAAGDPEKYYPVPQEGNRELYRRYREEAERLQGVLCVGRLADYQYYNMDQVVARVLKVVEP